MATPKSVLMIGLDPAVVDYSAYQGLDATILAASLKAQQEQLLALGYDAQWCLTDTGETAEAVVLERLGQKKYDCILIGAGVRANPKHFILFEKLINIVHEHAPHTKLCFNTNPNDTAESVQRWI